MNRRNLVLMLLLCLVASRASAAPVLVLLNGNIATAQGVVVDGKTYDVDFQDGLCVDVFGSCNTSTAFAFDSAVEAEAASQALLDQVLLDLGTLDTLYDFRYGLTNGCNDDSIVRFVECRIRTPWGVVDSGFGLILHVAAAINRSDGQFDQDEVRELPIDVTAFPDGQTFPRVGLLIDANYSWARWRLRSDDETTTGSTTGTVPEPASMTLLALAAGGLVLRRRSIN